MFKLKHYDEMIIIFYRVCFVNTITLFMPPVLENSNSTLKVYILTNSLKDLL